MWISKLWLYKFGKWIWIACISSKTSFDIILKMNSLIKLTQSRTILQFDCSPKINQIVFVSNWKMVLEYFAKSFLYKVNQSSIILQLDYSPKFNQDILRFIYRKIFIWVVVQIPIFHSVPRVLFGFLKSI